MNHQELQIIENIAKEIEIKIGSFVWFRQQGNKKFSFVAIGDNNKIYGSSYRKEYFSDKEATKSFITSFVEMVNASKMLR